MGIGTAEGSAAQGPSGGLREAGVSGEGSGHESGCVGEVGFDTVVEDGAVILFTGRTIVKRFVLAFSLSCLLAAGMNQAMMAQEASQRTNGWSDVEGGA